MKSWEALDAVEQHHDKVSVPGYSEEPGYR